MSEQHIDKNRSGQLENFSKDGVEIDVVAIFCRIISMRKTLYKAAGVGLIIGIIVALSMPKYYTVKVTLSPEMGGSNGNNGIAGLAASFLGTGATVGDGNDALNASLSSDIVSSTPFLLELLNMEILTSKKEKMTFAMYLEGQSSPWWSYVIGLPGMLTEGVKSIFISENIVVNPSMEIIELTKGEVDKIKYLKKNILASMDKKTAITAVIVTLQDPKVTAVVADSVVQKLQKYITNYRTSKAKDDCIYLDKLFKERQQEYYLAQKKYAEYIDSHDNLILQSVRAEQERLQNDMNLAYQVYSQVANQLQMARAKVQEVKPVFAVIEPAVIPNRVSGIGMKIYVLLFMFLAVICAIGWGIVGQNVWNYLRIMK